MVVKMNKSYLDFLQQTREDVYLPPIQKLDLLCKSLLEEIALAAINGKPLTVTDVISMSHFGAPSTLHRKVHILLQSEWIQIHFKAQNRRTKYLKLGEFGIAYFQRMTELMTTNLETTPY